MGHLGVVIFVLLRDLLTDESGATALEYGLIAGLVSIAAVAALTAIGITLNSVFFFSSNVMTDAAEKAAASAAARQ